MFTACGNKQTILCQLFLLLTVYFIQPGFTSEQVIASIDNLEKPVDLNPYIQYIEDPHRAMKYEDLKAGVYDDLWQNNTNQHFVARNSENRFWIRIDLSFAKDLSVERPLLFIDNHPYYLFDMRFWIQSEDSETAEMIKSGYLHRSRTGDETGKQYAIPVHKASGEYSVYGWIDNKQGEMPALLPLYLVSDKFYAEKNRNTSSLLSAFFAVMGALFLYNLCLLISLKQKIYAFYLCFLVSAAYLCAFIDGVIPEFLTPDNSQVEFVINRSMGFLLSVSYLTFVWAALDGLLFSPKLRTVFFALLAFGITAPLHQVFPAGTNYMAIMSQLYSAAVIIFSSISIIIGIKLKYPGAAYLFLAEISIIIGGNVSMLALNGLLPTNEWTYLSLHLGLLVEALLLSFVVAARTNKLIQEKFEAQALALAHEQKAKEALEIATKAKNEFLATVSHELRTPLTSIIGFSEAILDQQEATQTGQDYTRTILRSGKNLLMVIDDVLHLSLIDNDTVSINKRQVNLIELFNKSGSNHKFNAERKGLNFNINIENNLPQSAEIDDDSINQILSRLLENSIKFTNRGSVSLLVDYIKETVDQPQQLRIVVRDTGIGIAKDKMASIFDPFTQVDGSDERQFGGTGIGLFIAKSLSEKMQGSLTVESTVDVGTKFTCLIPISNIEQHPESPVIQSHAIRPNERVIQCNSDKSSSQKKKSNTKPKLKGRVLYAEDNIDNQNLVKVLVESTGAELVLADNGALAVEAMAGETADGNKPFDLVLMDLQMPVMNGRDATRELRGQGIQTPIIAFSASALNDAESVEENLFDGYLGKPVDRKKLYALLEEHLDQNNVIEVKETATDSISLTLMKTLTISYDKNTEEFSYATA